MDTSFSVLAAILVLCALVAPCSALSWASFVAWMKSLMSTATYDSEAGWPPAFCHDFDCPPFTVEENHGDWEIRVYDTSEWVSTTNYGPAGDGSMFMRLFWYIEGDNVNGTEIDMTTPVITRMTYDADHEAALDDRTMSFYVSQGLRAPVYKPAGHEHEGAVFPQTMDTMRVYVTWFGGWAGEDDWLEHAETLREQIPSSEQYDDSYFYSVGYDSPMKMWARHNEVWFIAN